MIRTDRAELQHEVDKVNRMIGDWYRYVKGRHHEHPGQSLRLYIDPRTWHDYIILEFGHYNESHMITLFGRRCEVYLVYGTEREHAYLTYEDGCYHD